MTESPPPHEILTLAIDFVTDLARKGIGAADLFVALRSIELCVSREIEAQFGPSAVAENEQIAFEVAKRIRVLAISSPNQVVPE